MRIVAYHQLIDIDWDDTVREIVCFMGAKEGSGTSTLAHAFAVECAESLNLKIADLDDLQRTSWEWGQCRAAAGLEPVVPVESASHGTVLSKAFDVELLVVDAPPCTGELAWRLAQLCLLTVVATRTGRDELDGTMR